MYDRTIKTCIICKFHRSFLSLSLLRKNRFKNIFVVYQLDIFAHVYFFLFTFTIRVNYNNLYKKIQWRNYETVRRCSKGVLVNTKILNFVLKIHVVNIINLLCEYIKQKLNFVK